jgi:hypothetical protein
MAKPVEMRPDAETDALKASQERARRRRVIAERIWYIALGLVALVLVASAGIVIAASQPTTCAVCHGTTFSSVESGTHAEVACEVCHSGSTVVGVLEGRLAVVNMTVATVFPSAIPVESNVPSERCLECHRSDIGQTIVVGNLRMDHRAPIAAGWECSSCHPAVAHEVADLNVGYTMDGCLGCHTANPANLATCDICHVEGERTAESAERVPSPWRITHGPNWEQTHGMGDLSTCGGCHPGGYCTRCHGANVPHPERYLAEHGKDVLAREDGSGLCLGCHREGSCDECHGVEMPHPDAILKTHSADVTAGGDELRAACMRCHQQSSCDGCHVRHTHPGLTPEHIDALRRNPVR